VNEVFCGGPGQKIKIYMIREENKSAKQIKIVDLAPGQKLYEIIHFKGKNEQKNSLIVYN